MWHGAGVRPERLAQAREVLMKRMIAWCVLAGMAAISTVAAQKPAAPPLVSGIDVAAFDKSVRPQDDFFRYVNGAWLDKTPIPADKPSYGSFEILYDKAQDDLRAIVEEAGKTGGAPGSDARKIGDFYASFMDEAKIDVARHHAAAGRTGRDRRDHDQVRPREGVRPHAHARLRHAARRLHRGRLQGSEDQRRLRLSERPRPARSRLLHEGRSRSWPSTERSTSASSPR